MRKQIYTVITISGVILLMTLIFNSCIQKETFAKATVETNQVRFVTEATATCGGIISTDGGATVFERGICWDTNPSPTTANDKSANGSGLGAFTANISGLIPSTTYYVRAYAINKLGTAYGNEVSFSTSIIVTDIDGNIYSTVKIGTQVWMIENLKTTKLKDGMSIPNVIDNSAWKSLKTPGYCFYNNDAANKNIYGALYNWYTVNTGKLAPTGWHVPTDVDWTMLENYLIANGYNYDGTTINNKIAKSLAATTGWNSDSNLGAIGNDLTKNNTSGFSALPKGYRENYGLFYNVGNIGYWWSSSEYSASAAWYRHMSFNDSGLTRYVYPNIFGLSVRCVMD